MTKGKQRTTKDELQWREHNDEQEESGGHSLQLLHLECIGSSGNKSCGQNF